MTVEKVNQSVTPYEGTKGDDIDSSHENPNEVEEEQWQNVMNLIMLEKIEVKARRAKVDEECKRLDFKEPETTIMKETRTTNVVELKTTSESDPQPMEQESFAYEASDARLSPPQDLDSQETEWVSETELGFPGNESDRGAVELEEVEEEENPRGVSAERKEESPEVEARRRVRESVERSLRTLREVELEPDIILSFDAPTSDANDTEWYKRRQRKKQEERERLLARQK